MKTKFLTLTLFFSFVSSLWASSPVEGLMERIDSGLSRKIEIVIVPDSMDFFELDQVGIKPVIRGNNDVSLAVGLNWYLRYFTGNHLSWGNMKAVLPDTLPSVDLPVRMSTAMPMRYYLNYCTHSYSMPFWDWERWQQEIDWMALHGINMPLAVTGTDVLWRNVLRRLGYPEERIGDFIAGPAFQAWWLMNNLEGWGGPNTDEYYSRQEDLQKKIVGRMREWGMTPVFAGYSGMVPHDAGETLGLDVADPGKWLGFTRPAFLQPSNDGFARVAEVYYDELEKLYGRTGFYSMDPFHEGGDTDGVDLSKAGKAILAAMKRANPDAVWVIQGWQANPRPEMLRALPLGDVVVLDLHAEADPAWSARPDGFSGHGWLYCMLHNFGGNIGLYGRIPTICREYPLAVGQSRSLRGIGLTMEGIETNPVLYELMCEMPWRDAPVDPDQWLHAYAAARYGKSLPEVDTAWSILGRTVYACPPGNRQQGTAESLFCARPSDHLSQASAWAQYQPYYDHAEVARAARLLIDAAPQFADNRNYLYDMVDVTRQAIADKGREVAARFGKAADEGEREAYALEAARFLRLIILQDRLLATMPDFRLGSWIEAARNCSENPVEKDRYEWNARVQITTWGNREASDGGRLHDYSNREWHGLLSGFYLPRWLEWFNARLASWDSPGLPQVDFYAMEEQWTRRHDRYSSVPEGDPVETASSVLDEALSL